MAKFLDILLGFDLLIGLVLLVISVTIFIKNKKQKNPSLLAFGWICLASFFMTGYLSYLGSGLVFTFPWYHGYFEIFIPYFGFLLINLSLSIMNEKFLTKKNFLLHSILPLAILIISLPDLLLTEQEKINMITNRSNNYLVAIPIFIYLLACIIYCIKKLNPVIKIMKFRASLVNSKVIFILLFTLVSHYILEVIALLLLPSVNQGALLTLPLFYFILIIAVIYVAIIHPSFLFEVKLAANIDREQKKEGNKYQHRNLDKKTMTGYLVKITNYIRENQAFLDKDMSLSKLSRLVEIESINISQSLNTGLNLSFNRFINSYRVDYVKALIGKGDYNNFTIDALGEKAGFNSKSTFYKSFKEFTGQTPSAYQKENSIIHENALS